MLSQTAGFPPFSGLNDIPLYAYTTSSLLQIHFEHFCCVLCQLKKNAQQESCELSFIWGKMRTIARETAS